MRDVTLLGHIKPVQNDLYSNYFAVVEDYFLLTYDLVAW